MEIFIVVAFLVFLGFREWLHFRQVKDLELKVAAKDERQYYFYKNMDAIHVPTLTKKKEETVNDDLVDPFSIKPKDALKGLIK